MEQKDGDSSLRKPIPLPVPRTLFQNSSPSSANVKSPNDKAKTDKPVPLPRQLMKKLTPNPDRWKTSPKTHAIDHNPESQTLTGDNKLSQAKTIEPFDEFEASLKEKDPALLRSVSFTSPLNGLTEEEKSRLSYISSSSSQTQSSSDSDYSEFSQISSRNNQNHRISDSSQIYDNVNILSRPVTPPLANPTENDLPEDEQQSDECSEQESYEGTCSQRSSRSIQYHRMSDSSECYENVRIMNGPVTPLLGIENSLAEDEQQSDEGLEQESYEAISSYKSSLSPKKREITIIKPNNLSKRATVPIADIPGNALSCSSLNSSFSYSDMDTPEHSAFPDSTEFAIKSSNSLFADFESKLKEKSILRDTLAAETQVSLERKSFGNVYEEVLVENGTVVFLDNPLDTLPARSPVLARKKSSSVTSRSSVIMEFDPLFSPGTQLLGHASGSLDLINFVTGQETEEHTENNEYLDRYASRNTKILSISMSPQSNPEYYPVAVETNRDSISKIADAEPEPSTTPIATGASSTLEEGNLDQVVNEDGTQSNIKRSQGSFLRRFSHKIKMKTIKEERNNSSNSNSSLSSTENIPAKVQPCEKCSEQHPEGSKCIFVPVIKEYMSFAGIVLKKTGILQKDFGTKRRAVLQNGKMQFMNEKQAILEEFSLEKVITIVKRDDVKVPNNELKCFEVNFVGGKSPWILATQTEEERGQWCQKYIQSFTGFAFPEYIVSSMDRGGWCYLKEYVTSNWRPAWLVLKDRLLSFCFHSNNESGPQAELDLRKVRSIVITNSKDNGHECPYADNGDVLTLDVVGRIYYIQTESTKNTSAWEKAITAAAKKNGFLLEDMQLTGENIPVAIDKCIDFLYAHGTLAEGIYRQSGSNTRISQLLQALNTDAWSVQLQGADYTAHDVAGVLKRFFRTLPSPLLTTDLYRRWIYAAGCTSMQDKLEQYSRLLDELPIINYNILKKLICHLHAIHDLHEKNLMPMGNLAPIWGPTLMNVEPPTAGVANGGTGSGTGYQYIMATSESVVVGDLIDNYYELFKIDSESRERERKMQEALETFHMGTTRSKNSGDMKIWIYIWEKDETTAINITLTPNSTSSSIVQQLCVIAKIRTTENLALHEVVCQKSLERPLHPSEIVIETVLRWSIWDVDERKENFLILKKNTLYPALLPYAKDPEAVFGEFKYADSKSKSFRKYNFQFSGAVLKYFKDTKLTVELGSWKIEDIVWYMGSEPKRTPPSRWVFTFVKRNYSFQRSRDGPYFGNVVTCNSEEELHKWIAAMVVGEHPDGLYPLV